MRWLLFALVVAASLIPGADFVPWEPAYAASATFEVTSTADTGGTTCAADCTLRQAIGAANGNGNPTEVDRITFNIPGGGVQTITLESQLPSLTQPVTVEGDTQPGASCGPTRNLLIEIDANGVAAIGLFLAHGAPSVLYGSTVRGMTIHGATGYTISVSAGTGHVVECMNIGTNAAGTAAAGSPASVGVIGAGITSAPRFGGPTVAQRNIVGNTGTGVYATSPDVEIAGNYIGVGADGTTAIPNTTGVSLSSTNATVGGPDAASRNVISGNGAGLEVAGSAPTISYNYLGLSADGTSAVPNTGRGLALSSVTDALVSHNVISGNVSMGISMQNVTGARIFSNIIGLAADGQAALGNSSYGVLATSSSGIEFGSEGTNIVSANSNIGLSLSAITESEVRGNIIGYAADGTTLRPNGSTAILVLDGSSNVIIGGLAPGNSNAIYAELAGTADRANAVYIGADTASAPVGISVRGNSLRSDGHAINLRPISEQENLVTPNDGEADDDLGPNALLNAPVLTAVTPGATPVIEGTLSTAPGNYLVQLYASGECNSTNSRQAWRLLGATAVMMPSGGTVAFSATPGSALASDEYVTATATATTGDTNTSELSACYSASGLPVLTSVTPDLLVAGTAEAELDIVGENFTASSFVSWDGIPLQTTFNSDTSLTATVLRAEIGMSGHALFAVTIDDGQGGMSNEVGVTVVASSSDVNCDETATSDDAAALLRHLAGLGQIGPQELKGCSFDANRDEDVDLADALWIRKEVALLIDNPLPKINP